MHFVAHCQRYPQFALNVHELRPFLDKKGYPQEATVVHFRNGFYDTKEEGLSEEEAVLVHQALKRCDKFPPLYGTQIMVKEYPQEQLPEQKKGK